MHATWGRNMPDDQKPTIHYGEAHLRAGFGRQHARPKTEKVDTVLKDRFPPDGHPPPEMGDTELWLVVCDHMREHWSRLFSNIPFYPKLLPSIESVLRSELVGRKER
jgi:hypothetical protein